MFDMDKDKALGLKVINAKREGDMTLEKKDSDELCL